MEFPRSADAVGDAGYPPGLSVEQFTREIKKVAKSPNSR